jgi:hypothetical protein
MFCRLLELCIQVDLSDTEMLRKILNAQKTDEEEKKK